MEQKNSAFDFQLIGLVKTFGKQTAVADFSLKINAGDCIGLIGPNGAGKTTLLRMLAGILQPTKGEICFQNKPIEKQRDKIGYLPQFPHFYEWMSAEEVLIFSAQLFKMQKSEIARRVDEVLKLVGLLDARAKKVGDFSGGMRQRLGIAQAVIHKPQFIILDEPVSALDPLGRREVLDLIEIVKKEATVIFSTHILADAEEVCNRFCVMNKSRKIEDFYYRDLQKKHLKNSMTIQVKTKDPKWLAHLQKMSEINNIVVSDNEVYLESSEKTSRWQALVLQSLSDYQIAFLAIMVDQFSLEEYFMRLVGDIHA